MRSLTGWDWTTLVLVIVGGLNWGLVALNPSYDLVALIFGGITGAIARILYAIIGLSALYLIFVVGNFVRK